MNITLEQVDEILKRKNVSYTQAKVALEEAEGDLLTALTLLDDEADQKAPKKSKGLMDGLRDGLRRLHHIRVRLIKEGDVLVSLPGTVATLLVLLNIPVALFIMVVLLFVGFKMEFQNTGRDEKINSTVNKMKEAVEDQLK